MRTHNIFKLIIGIGLSGLIVACSTGKIGKSTKPKDNEPVLLTLGTHEVTLGEFEYLYNKNHQGEASAYTEESLRSYMDLFIAFKLKVLEAYDQKIDQDSAFIKELAKYQSELEKPYMTGKRFTAQVVEDTYNRLKEEVKASHILIRFPENSKDTLAAYEKIQKVQQELNGGADFEELAVKYSEDPSVKQNKGSLGYFTALQMVFPFEDAAYKTEIGQVSDIVRTRFGYHLIKVFDKRAARGEVKVAHLMLKTPNNASEENLEKVKQKANEIYQKAINGEDWNKLCRQYSEDKPTAQKGGELPWLTASRVPAVFAEAAYGLDNNGDIAAPVQTRFGWHIIKLIGKKPLPPFEDMKADLEKKVSRDERSQLSGKIFIDSLKVEDRFVENTKNLTKVMALFDSTLIEGKWQPSELISKYGKKEIFSISEMSVPASKFWEFIGTEQKEQSGQTVEKYATKLYDDFWQKELLAYEKAHLEDKYPEYKYLLKEYHDGILLFRVMEQEVWGRATDDAVGLEAYFESHRDNFMFDQRVKATIYDAGSEVVLSKVQTALKHGYYEVSPSEIVEVNFRKGRYGLTTSLKKDLNKVVALLSEDKTLKVGLTGQYVKGEKAYLADKRAAGVLKYIESKGIDKGRVSLLDSEESVPSGKGRTKGGRTKLTYYSTDLSSLEKNLNKESSLALKIRKGIFDKGDNAAVDKVEWKEGQSVVKMDDRVSVVVIEQILPPAPKELKDARGEVIAAYQELIEQEWLSSLKEKFTPKVNEELLLQMVKKGS